MVGSPKNQQMPCQVCGENRPDFFASKNGFQLYQCRSCQLVYQDPMPTDDELSELYADAYDGNTAGYFIKANKKMRRSRRLISRIRRRASGRRFLDIGCNGGFMVEAAHENGLDAVGIELDPISLEYAQRNFPDNEYFHGRVEEYQPIKPFDIVYCSEVVEHVSDSNSFISAAARLMRPGALLYLTTPDISHWRRPNDISRWDAFCPPAHCIYFNPKNLTKLLSHHGLSVAQKRWAWKPGIRLYAYKTN